jgi:hypothetical protein
MNRYPSDGPAQRLHNPSVRVLWLVAFLTLSLPAQARSEAGPAASASVSGDLAQRLAWVRALRYDGPTPELTGFSPAQPVQGFSSPAGAHGHTQAYRSDSGCIAFFYPLAAHAVSDVAFKWNGPACTGQLLAGPGELQILRREGDALVVSVLQGTFAQGALHGNAAKADFRYALSGQPGHEVYRFEGEFVHSVLHGAGMVRWSGPADARPSAWSRQGHFRHGLIYGGVAQGRLHPYAGVEAEVQALRFADDGSIIVQQAQASGGEQQGGTLFFENDPNPWVSELETWHGGQPQSARYTRVDRVKEQLLSATCHAWRFEPERLVCAHGEIAAGTLAGTVGVTQTAYAIRLPAWSHGAPFTLPSALKARVGLGDSEFDAQCAPDMRRCTGHGAVPIATGRHYWHGDIEWRDGALIPVAAALYERPHPHNVHPGSQRAGSAQAHQQAEATSPKPPGAPADRARLVARCARFTTPTDCADGEVLWDAQRFKGSWQLAGVRFRSVAADRRGAPRYQQDDPPTAVPQGWGELVLGEHHRAEVRFDGGLLREVRRCTRVHDGQERPCRIESGQLVMPQDGLHSTLRGPR